MTQYEPFKPKQHDKLSKEDLWYRLNQPLYQPSDMMNSSMEANPYPSLLGFQRTVPAEVINKSNKRTNELYRTLPPKDTPVERMNIQNENNQSYLPNSAAASFSEDHNKLYTDLVRNKAYRFPNPGSYKYREGKVGSSWRNVKQVLTYGGNTIVFLDGAVRLYDTSGLNDEMKDEGTRLSQRQVTSLYAPNLHDLQ